jgi:hypothetical protein
MRDSHGDSHGLNGRVYRSCASDPRQTHTPPCKGARVCVSGWGVWKGR